MNIKDFKSDLTYCCKKFMKEGKILSSFADNLSIEDIEGGRFFSETNYLDPLEMFILMKGYKPEQNWRSFIGYNINILNVLEINTGFSKENLYSFLDGFENFNSDYKNEFYNLGCYIREKFIPFGVSSELIKIKKYTSMDLGIPLYFFAIYSKRGNVLVVEAKGLRLKPIHDSSIAWLPEGEFRVLITAPDILFEKKTDGTFGSPVFHSHAIYFSSNEAIEVAKNMIVRDEERTARKMRVEVDQEKLDAKLKAIKLQSL